MFGWNGLLTTWNFWNSRWEYLAGRCGLDRHVWAQLLILYLRCFELASLFCQFILLMLLGRHVLTAGLIILHCCFSTPPHRFLTIILGSIGIVIIGMIAQRWWTKRIRRLNEEAVRRRRDASQRSRRRCARDRQLNELQQCLVCYQNPREIILLPCGHVCLCLDCSERINDLCPVCRAEIQSKATAYIA